MVGIYKITNLINGKCYIGQSTNIKRRWNNHKSDSVNIKSPHYNYHLYRAFRKYGIENFSFEIIEECCVKDLDEKEQYYIDEYDSINMGYNQVLVNQKGVSITPKIFSKIIEELQNNQHDSTEQIGKKFNLSGRHIRMINNGEVWFRDDLTYPIRPPFYNVIINKKSYNKQTKQYECVICHKSIWKGCTYCRECNSKLQQKAKRPSRDELKQMIRTMPFLKIAKEFNVSNTSITHWCLAYNLPSKKKEIKKYSDEEWRQI